MEKLLKITHRVSTSQTVMDEISPHGRIYYELELCTMNF